MCWWDAPTSNTLHIYLIKESVMVKSGNVRGHLKLFFVLLPGKIIIAEPVGKIKMTLFAIDHLYLKLILKSWNEIVNENQSHHASVKLYSPLLTGISFPKWHTINNNDIVQGQFESWWTDTGLAGIVSERFPNIKVWQCDLYSRSAVTYSMSLYMSFITCCRLFSIKCWHETG